MTLKARLDAVKRAEIARALHQHGGNVTLAARALGVCRELIYRYSSPTQITQARTGAEDRRTA